jgi:hypothetical protein
MLEFIVGFIIGALVLDFLWAWKFGIPQIFWKKLTFALSKITKKWKYR